VVGCTPLFGLHLPVCVALAWLFGLNKIVVYGAANLSVPPMIPLLGFVSVQIGERLLHGRWLALAVADFRAGGLRALAHRFFAAWLVGGLALGAAVGAVAGALVYAALRARAARRRAADGAQGMPLGPLAVERALAAARARYDGLPGRYKWYARLKYRMDPAYRAIGRLVPPGAFTVDLGTGLGMLPVLLGLLGEGRRALGVEWDAGKVACGRHAASGLVGVEVVEGDVRAFALPRCQVITLVDVLHYYDAAAQRELLGRCRAALADGGRLLIREGDRGRSGGARLTRALEWLAVRLGWNRGPEVRFRPVAELVADLEALGLSARVDQVAGRLHPGNVLLVAERARRSR
jgi:SAM-dependent methyltransferase